MQLELFLKCFQVKWKVRNSTKFRFLQAPPIITKSQTFQTQTACSDSAIHRAGDSFNLTVTNWPPNATGNRYPVTKYSFHVHRGGTKLKILSTSTPRARAREGPQAGGVARMQFGLILFYLSSLFFAHFNGPLHSSTARRARARD